MATFEGIVQGVVVQMRKLAGAVSPASGCSAGNATWIAGSVRSSYSSSASASAVRSVKHQRTDLSAWYTRPLP